MSRTSVSQRLATEVLSRGKSVSGKFFRAVYLRVPQEPSRYSFVVSKKIAKTSPMRNRIKRRGRSVIGKEVETLPRGTMVLFFAKAGVAGASYQDIKNDLSSLSESIR